ncbi:MAG: hypothetical protein QNK37_05910 [Acidobacteriota bacterium]|nr:hypothetical protein [Acidobacteriota bacterium]
MSIFFQTATLLLQLAVFFLAWMQFNANRRKEKEPAQRVASSKGEQVLKADSVSKESK